MPNRSPPGSGERSSARRPTAPKTPCTPNLGLSVPSDRFGAALDELRGLGEEVTTDTVSGQDVTREYVDLQSRERNLLAAEQSLLDLYNRAGDLQDVLSIQRELTGILGQIEQI